MLEPPSNIAIIGAGFAALAAAHALLENKETPCHITLFHKDPVGVGASGVAAGLLHPYPGSKFKESFKGTQALHEAISLLNKAQLFSDKPLFIKSGIVKLALDDDQKKEFSKACHKYENLKFKKPEELSSDLFINSSHFGIEIENGFLVYSQKYLIALKRLVESLGATFNEEKIFSLTELKHFDKIIVCSGYGIKELHPSVSLKYVKGQILTCLLKEPLVKKPVIANGYICPTIDPLVYTIGSSYEHHFKSDSIDTQEARRKILIPWQKIFPMIQEAQILECQAGVRVMHPPTYLPFLKKIDEKTTVFTGLGSRGLLYHAYLAKGLKDLIFKVF